MADTSSFHQRAHAARRLAEARAYVVIYPMSHQLSVVDHPTDGRKNYGLELAGN